MNNFEFTHSFPAVRGIQAGKPCYIAMCPMRLIPTLFQFDEEEVPPELRAQRTINKSRIPEITSYLVENPNDYTLSSLTASVNAMVNFEPLSDTGIGQNMGALLIPMDAQILINDGQHRRASIEQAIKENPELGHDNISVLFFIDEGLQRSLYDYRDSLSGLARHLSNEVNIFSRMTELEKSSISNRSSKLFTLSSIKNASKALLRKGGKDLISEEDKLIATYFWSEVTQNMPDWIKAKDKKLMTSELREQYIHAHGVMLQAMGNVGADLLSNFESDWKKRLTNLSEIDWSRQNKDWEGRALIHGRVSKARSNVLLTGNYIKQHLGIALNDIEEKLEKEFQS
ncbi:MAG: DGQHR domain-containing protein [Methylobacter sp.]|nr:DGQHR domain-containing protein [Methylobacter sp.]